MMLYLLVRESSKAVVSPATPALECVSDLGIKKVEYSTDPTTTTVFRGMPQAMRNSSIANMIVAGDLVYQRT
jgi:hypothetical protein